MFHVRTFRQIHTAVSKFNSILPCSQPLTRQKPICGYMNLAEKQRLAAIETHKKKLEDEFNRSKDPTKLHCCHKINMPLCKRRLRDGCDTDPFVRQPASCTKWQVPIPAFSECRCVRKFFPKKCPECGPHEYHLSCQGKKFSKMINCLKQPQEMKFSCKTTRPKLKMIPWADRYECEAHYCVDPYRADDENPPKVWKKLTPIFPSLKPRTIPRGW